MAKIQFADIWPQLMGLVPSYSREGVNGTSILLEKDPTILSEVKTKTLLAQLTRTFLLDPRVVREVFSHVCGRRYAIPMALRQGLVLIPVRARVARVKDDGTRAYLVKDKIRRHLPEDKGSKYSGTRFIFVNGTTLTVPHRYSSMQPLMMAAELVEQEAARLVGYLIDRTSCEVREGPPEVREGSPRGHQGDRSHQGDGSCDWSRYKQSQRGDGDHQGDRSHQGDGSGDWSTPSGAPSGKRGPSGGQIPSEGRFL